MQSGIEDVFTRVLSIILCYLMYLLYYLRYSCHFRDKYIFNLNNLRSCPGLENFTVDKYEEGDVYTRLLDTDLTLVIRLKDRASRTKRNETPDRNFSKLVIVCCDCCVFIIVSFPKFHWKTANAPFLWSLKFRNNELFINNSFYRTAVVDNHR